MAIVGTSFYGNYNLNKRIDSTIGFDVNPSIEINVNKKNKVISARAFNSEGKSIINDMNLKDSDLNIAVNAIIGSMYKNGYLNELKNSILVTVENKDKKKAEKLQTDLTKEINSTLSTYNVEGAILTQGYVDDDAIEKKAKELGLSKGKTEFIERILENGLTKQDGTPYIFDDLVDLKINELNVILNSISLILFVNCCWNVKCMINVYLILFPATLLNSLVISTNFLECVLEGTVLCCKYIPHKSHLYMYPFAIALWCGGKYIIQTVQQTY